MKKDKIKGRDQQQDAAEKWLSDNDPDYANTKKGWETPSTDALARSRVVHSTLEEVDEMQPRGSGNYHRRGNRFQTRVEDLADLETDDE